MSFTLGVVVEEQNVKQDKEREVTMKEICAYSGEKIVFSRIGRFNIYSDGMMVRVVDGDKTVATLYNAVVVVKEDHYK